MSEVQTISIPNFTTHTGAVYEDLPLHFQHFGKDYRKAPIVLINHSLTGDANVSGKGGWWGDIVGPDRVIDTDFFAVIAFNIPGNGVKGQVFDNHQDFHTGDIARIFYQGLSLLKIETLYAIIGGSIGGSIAWEMAVQYSQLTKLLIPIAADWKASDWILANTFLQERILKNSADPVRDARIHAMLTYRTPESLNTRFRRTQNETVGIANVESWLLHHGEKLHHRFDWKAYRLMNTLLASVDIARNGENPKDIIAQIEARIHIIAIDSDLLFSAAEDRKTFEMVKPLKETIFYQEIKSIHGHDAFLIESKKMEMILKNIICKEDAIPQQKKLQKVI